MDTAVKKLTIGILTYNNSIGLKSELECIISQIKATPELEKDVNILVSDNSDNEKTSLLIKAFLFNTPNLFYIKNEKNLGFDRNVDQVLTKSNGLFCWTLSDNDPILDGGIKKVLDVIKNYPNIAHILINANTNKEDVSTFENMEGLIIKNNNKIMGGLISQNIFNRKFLPQDRSKYYNNQWFHLSIALEICAERNVALIPNIFKKQEEGECCWAKNGMTFITYTNLHSIVMNLKNFNYSKKFLEIYHRNFIRELPHQVVTAKLYGLLCNKKNIKILHKHTKKNKFVFILCMLIMLTPIFILKKAKMLWKKL